MVPTPYDVRWTIKLIRRDLKVIAARCSSRVRDRFKRTSADTSDPTSHVTQAHTDAVNDRESVFYDASESHDLPSLVGPDTDGNKLIVAEDGSEGISEVFISSYEFLTASHKTLFASRERDLLCKERWLFRGAWLLLHQAIQYHESNPIYKIWKDGPSEVEETGAFQPILRKYAHALNCSRLIYLEEHTFSSPTTSRPSRISQMPAMAYTQRGKVHTRHDSIFSTISTRSSSHISQGELWYIIEAGALDRAKTALAAECLLNHIWDEKDAMATLDAIGDPAKQLSEEDDTELRKRLGQTLCSGRYVDRR